ncbi:MAG: MBL fold metallo-hydrolase [Gammaproteobacteria bacterium RIFCSPLOWO2_12_FULL_52_10]|nr:MAG: MBL fold metallo-hydrolase [Gammaproteobacteria bacterium RIFCSPLOWO2_12_FULL_52_10]
MPNNTLQVQIVPVTPFQQNCSVLICTATKRAAVVDPGGDLEQILHVVKNAGAAIEKILVTHAHIDHAGAVAELAGLLRVPVEGPHRDDQFWIERLPLQGREFGLPAAAEFIPDRWLEEGDTVTFGNIRLDVHHCPGHTPGHVIFFHPESKLAIVGDVLFRGSIGRTDFPRGDYASLIHSIRERLWPLGDDVQFIPGHGPMSTFGYERRTNPFVADGL